MIPNKPIFHNNLNILFKKYFEKYEKVIKSCYNFCMARKKSKRRKEEGTKKGRNEKTKNK